MISPPLLNPAELLARVAARIPESLRSKVVVIGSIASAWAFRSLVSRYSVATKDIDLLLRPAVDAVATAEALGQQLIDEGWTPWYPDGVEPGAQGMNDDQLPALRLSPPDDQDRWFVELIAEPPAVQTERRYWRRISVEAGVFGLPSFRYMPVAVHDAEQTPFGLRVARPACMALAHLLEHASPDTTPIRSLTGGPARYIKDVGRAVSLWWLAREQSPLADVHWRATWRQALSAVHPAQQADMGVVVANGLASLEDELREAHRIAVYGLLAAHGTTLDAYRRAYAGLMGLARQF